MEKGFTLLYAVLISSIALTIGLGAFSLVYGELVLAGSARDAMIALYAADAGIECAAYWDYNFMQAAVFDNDGTPDRIYCFGDTSGKLVGGGSTPEYTSAFSYTLTNGASVAVSVFKDQSFDGDATDDFTRTLSKGRNTAALGPRTAERVLRDTHLNPY